MQHFILRCSHCRREYVYCTYGNGPAHNTGEGCSQEYCAECQKKINEALSTIPVKFEPRFIEIDDKSLLDHFNRIRKENKYTVCTYENENSDFDVIETYYYNHNKYKVKWNEGKEDEKHIFVAVEYDLINQSLGKKKWIYNVRDSYSQQMNLKNMLSTLHVTSSKIPKPTGELLYMDFQGA